MGNYVLVHGGSANKSVWNKVLPYIEERGHQVFVPSLSDEKTSSLTDYISEVSDLIENEDLDDVILVGHSHGGLIITGVADRMPEKIHHLIYIDTLIPMNGKSLFDLFAFYHTKTGDYDLDPFEPYVEPLYYDEEKINQIPKTHIRCLKSEFIQISRKAMKDLDARAKEGNWETFELDTVHTCMLTMPKEVAEILLKYKVVN